MALFSKLPNNFIITRKNGIFKQCELYERGGEIYAEFGGGFVRVMAEGRTSAPSLTWEPGIFDFTPVNGEFGRMFISDNDMRMLRGQENVRTISHDKVQEDSGETNKGKAPRSRKTKSISDGRSDSSRGSNN